MAKDWGAGRPIPTIKPTQVGVPCDWQATCIPRPELAALAGIADSDQRLFLRFYLRSNIEKDLEEARKRCEAFGVDYEVARAEARKG